MTHEPDREIKKLREHLANPETPLLFLFGAGTSCSVNIGTPSGTKDKPARKALIPDMAGVTARCEQELNKYDPKFQNAWKSLSEEAQSLLKEAGRNIPVNVEHILNRLRAKAEAASASDILVGLSKKELEDLEKLLKKTIATIVKVDNTHLNHKLPHIQLASWLKSAGRKQPVEIFTTNYDILFEYSFEQLSLPYFDGFVGGFQPFFYADGIDEPELLPSKRWVRFWKLHGSVGWKIVDSGSRKQIIRTTDQDGDELIYPSQLKYDQSRKQPYMAMIDRFTTALNKPNTILVTVGYSFGDDHLNSIIFNTLENRSLNNAYCLAFEDIQESTPLSQLALNCPRLAVLAGNSAVINGRYGEWNLGSPITTKVASYLDALFDIDAPELETDEPKRGRLRLGDFNCFASFLQSFENKQFKKPK